MLRDMAEAAVRWVDLLVTTVLLGFCAVGVGSWLLYANLRHGGVPDLLATLLLVPTALGAGVAWMAMRARWPWRWWAQALPLLAYLGMAWLLSVLF